MFDHQADTVLLELDQLFLQTNVRSVLDVIVDRVLLRLEQDAVAVMAWEPVPLDVYGANLPDGIRSSWVFTLRHGCATGAERHPNSIQRVMSYRGRGDLQTKSRNDDDWRSHPLASDPVLPVAQRWLTIPESIWHQAVVTGQNWAVVSFHTAGTEELIEERPDPQHHSQVQQRHYVTETP